MEDYAQTHLQFKVLGVKVFLKRDPIYLSIKGLFQNFREKNCANTDKTQTEYNDAVCEAIKYLGQPGWPDRSRKHSVFFCYECIILSLGL